MTINEVQLSPKDIMGAMIDSASLDFQEIERDEIEGDYSDAMLSMERTEAFGYYNGLEAAYKVFFGEDYNSIVELDKELD